MTPPPYIEIFHSKPSWPRCHLLTRVAPGTAPEAWAAPCAANELRDAEHIRRGFRVFRSAAPRLEFVLTNGSSRLWESNDGAGYVVDAPGRYVVEHGIRRVGDAHAGECAQVLERSDVVVQILFRGVAWGRCCLCVQVDGGAWTPPPGVDMRRVEGDGGGFEIAFKADRAAFAFSDGGESWDSKLGENYRVGCPGKYVVKEGVVEYVGPPDAEVLLTDLSAPPAVSARPAPSNPVSVHVT